MPQQITERYGKLEEMDRSFDLQFWRSQPDEARFEAVRELIELAWEVEGRDVGELRLQRTVEAFHRPPG